MKKSRLLLTVVLVIVLPGVLFGQFEKEDDFQLPIEARKAESETKDGMGSYLIKVKDKNQITMMEMEDYICGVVLGEMPAGFEMEALKAQAVATRTYTLRKILKQGKHDDAHVCTNASCCQAYISRQDYLASKGTEEDIERINSAVKDTELEVITYKGELIEATYFSCSGGITEDSVAVWGTDVPYLQSVVSPGENKSKYFKAEKNFTVDEFLHLLGLPVKNVLLNDDIVLTYTDGNGVETMTLLGATYTGTQVRKLLGLPSTAFSVSVDDNEISIITKGYGHRVGMSQYGADAMAVAGSTYDEILQHYYQGTSLCLLSENQIKGLFDKAGNI